MTGIILAAGRGARLRPAVGAIPKCLMRMGAATLLERQIASLQQAGVDRIAVVAGYRADRVRRLVPSDVLVAYNNRFGSTNSLYSLWVARAFLNDACVILNGDVLFHPQLLVDLLTAQYEDALLVSWRREAFGDEEMKVRIRRGRVTEIAKTIPDSDADAENVGIAKFGADGAAALRAEADRLVRGGVGHTAWLPAAFDALCRQRVLHTVDSRGYPWIEIDFPEDYWCACRDVLPAIEAADGQRSRARRQVAAAGRGRTRYYV
jgi:choline kinase